MRSISPIHASNERDISLGHPTARYFNACCRIVEAAASAHFDQAISDCRSAVEACTDDEDTSRLFTNMSLLYHQKEDWNKAIEMAERV